MLLPLCFIPLSPIKSLLISGFDHQTKAKQTQRERERTNLLMSTMASSSYPSLCSSPPLTRTPSTKQNPSLSFPLKLHSLTKKTSSVSISNTQLLKSLILVPKATPTESTQSEVSRGEGGGDAEEKFEEYEVEIEQPYGLKFAKGRDGGVYIDAIGIGGSADKTGKFTVGDRVIATSAVFGTEMWPAAEYGRTMYTIRQRIGPLLMRMEKRNGKIEDSGELTEKEIIRAERNSGVVSSKVREIQMQNYLKKKEQKQLRENDLREGLKLYKERKYEESLDKFESVLGSKPELDEASIASYNVACCYSKLNQVQAGLSALEDALKAGFEDFNRVRTDPDLANLRAAEGFDPLLKRFDESFINESAINAIKSLFGFNKK